MKKDKPTLFCIHGGPGLDHQSLLPGLNSLQDLFTLKFVDLRWEGLSSVEAYASQVCEVVRETAPASPIGIFGHSFGGHVAMEAMAAAPAFFDFGILCATFCNAADWVEYMSFTSKMVPHSNATEIEKSYHQSLKNNVMETVYAKIDMTQRCRRIMAKCLVIGGGQDKIVPPDEPHKLAKLIHNVTAAIINDAGHFPFLTKPDEFQRIVEQHFTSAGISRDA